MMILQQRIKAETKRLGLEPRHACYATARFCSVETQEHYDETCWATLHVDVANMVLAYTGESIENTRRVETFCPTTSH